jgi:hypothetical protein
MANGIEVRVQKQTSLAKCVLTIVRPQSIVLYLPQSIVPGQLEKPCKRMNSSESMNQK